MKTLLLIQSSMHGDKGESSQLTQIYADTWRNKNPNGKVVKRDLSLQTPPHLDAVRFSAFTAKPEERNAAQKQAVADSDTLIDELKNADELVIGMPMYNFGIPSQFKAYLDHVARAGVTFKYTDKGPQGLLRDIKTVIITARAGIYQNTSIDVQVPYLKTILAFIGINNVHFIYAEGMAYGDAHKAKSLTDAKEQIAQLA